MSLSEAIATAFRLQPRLRVYLEGVEQARGGQQVAFAPFLPTASAGYNVGGFNLNVGGEGVSLSGSSIPVQFLPPTGTVPIGLNIESGYELGRSCGLQWFLVDFGRRLGRYRQAEIAVDVWPNHSKVNCAFQTITHEVATAYYQVLQDHGPAGRTAEEAGPPRPGGLTWELARKLKKGGRRLAPRTCCGPRWSWPRPGTNSTAAEAVAGVAGVCSNLAVGLNVKAAPRR